MLASRCWKVPFFCVVKKRGLFYMNKLRIQVWIEIAICAGIALFLDVIVPTPSFAFVISIKMLPIIILSLRRGLLAGVIGGFIWGLLQFVIGDAYILSIVQFIVEYFVAFALVGLAGVLSGRMQTHLRDLNISSWRSRLMCMIVIQRFGDIEPCFRYI